MWNRSSPISSTAILCKIRQVTFLLSSPDLMSPLICKFWAGVFCPGSPYGSWKLLTPQAICLFRKRRKNLVSPLSPHFPLSKDSLESLDNVLTQGNATVFEENLCESVWDFIPPVLPAPRTLHLFFFFHWGSSPAPALPCTINMHCSSFSTCPPHAVARSNFRRAGLRDSYQKHSPTSGAASARSIELECRCSRVITRAKCTTTSWSCSIWKGEQSVSGSIAAFPDEREKIANTHERLYRLMVERWRGYLTSKVCKVKGRPCSHGCS